MRAYITCSQVEEILRNEKPFYPQPSGAVVPQCSSMSSLSAPLLLRRPFVIVFAATDSCCALYSVLTTARCVMVSAIKAFSTSNWWIKSVLLWHHLILFGSHDSKDVLCRCVLGQHPWTGSVCIMINTVLQTLVIIQGKLMPKMPRQPLPWQ